MPRCVLAGVLSLVLLSACGNSRAPVPESGQPAAPAGFHTISYRAFGLRVSVPNSWNLIRGRPPRLATIFSGQAVIALWRYRRRARLPVTRPQLTRARAALITAIRARRPGMRLISSKLIELDGRAAVELELVAQIGSGLRRVRSTHVYAGHVELVLDEYAPPAFFHRVDRQVFIPLRRSLLIARR